MGSHLVTIPNVPPTTSSLHSTGSNTCLLKTAIGNISAHGYCIEANILFDEGSQQSLLPQSLANSLNLQPHTTKTVALSTFSKPDTRTMTVPVATVHLPIIALQADYTT